MTRFCALSIAIVAMTRDNNTAANGTGDEDSIADVVGGGEYDWTPGERGLLLSGFFYLYVITQIPGKSTPLTLFPLICSRFEFTVHRDRSSVVVPGGGHVRMVPRRLCKVVLAKSDFLEDFRHLAHCCCTVSAPETGKAGPKVIPPVL